MQRRSLTKHLSVLAPMVVTGILAIAVQARGAVLLDSTFDCPDWVQGTSLNCQGIEWPSGIQTVNGKKTTISAVSNNPAGAGKGVRFWNNNLETGGRNSATLSWNYLAGGSYPPQNELWIRWYQKYMPGFRWVGGEPYYDKTLYVRAEAVSSALPQFAPGSKYCITAQGAPDYYQVCSSFSWADLMGGETSDGQWHCFEIQIKMDSNGQQGVTAGANGVGRIWIDGGGGGGGGGGGWSNGSAEAKQGWKWFNFDENQSQPDNPNGEGWVDYDDIVIYNSPPPNRDPHGNPFIGPIGWNGSLPDAGAPQPDASAPRPDASAPRPDASAPRPDASASRPDAGDVPGAVTDLAVIGTTTSSATLSFTEVDDGAGQPASYDVRFSQPPMNWGSATQTSQGTCSVPMAGQSTGATRTCTVEGLAEATSYEFRLVAFRGTLQVNAVFGPLSNVAQGTTVSGGAMDAGLADASGPGPDAGSCIAGAPCTSPDGCQSGIIDCLSGQPQCGHWTNVADGTACQGSKVCHSGECRSCPTQEPCRSADGCRLGTTNCATGEAVCEDLTNEPDGTACGNQGTCQDGACSACPAGETCTSIDGCQVGSIDCSQQPAVCGAWTNRPNGVACSGGVCREGICRACTPGAACSLSEPCKLGAIECAATGEPVCEAKGDLADGTACPGGVCHAGWCEPVALTDAGDPCGAGTHLDPSSQKCVADAIADAGPSAPPIEPGCGCAAATSASAPLLLVAGLLGLGLRRRRGSAEVGM
ncbi:MAG: fibronectin type III domain-containing protein [Deltaproteobacteria bacterium]|nr:fibronectin type III domain-containing protein [Deltaproteobacteria bacterium]